MFKKGIILNWDDYNMLWDDFIEILSEMIKELDRKEMEKFLRSRKELEEWVKEQVIGLFDSILEDNDVEAAIIDFGDKLHYVSDGEDFYNLSYEEGDISNVIEEYLEEELRQSVKRSRRRK
jgi:transposase